VDSWSQNCEDGSMSELPGPLSLPFRTVQKNKTKKAGTALVVAGVPILGLGIFGFVRGGAEMLGVWGVVLGLGLIGAGTAVLVRASRMR
jgi:hypothetical protein